MKGQRHPATSDSTKAAFGGSAAFDKARHGRGEEVCSGSDNHGAGSSLT